MQGNMHEIRLPLLASAKASSTVKSEHKGLWHKSQPCTVGGRGRSPDRAGRTLGTAAPLSLAAMEIIITGVQSRGKGMKGRGRHVSVKAPACAFSEPGGKHCKGLDYPEDWAFVYPKKLF